MRIMVTQRETLRNKESGIRNQESGIRNQESGIRNIFLVTISNITQYTYDATFYDYILHLSVIIVCIIVR